MDIFGLFDLVSHEVGHCLTIGHVGDGAEGKWGGLPSNDIMAYDSDPRRAHLRVQHRRRHAVPEPDLGLTPGERTNWTPEPAEEPPAEG